MDTKENNSATDEFRTTVLPVANVVMETDVKKKTEIHSHFPMQTD